VARSRPEDHGKERADDEQLGGEKDEVVVIRWRTMGQLDYLGKGAGCGEHGPDGVAVSGRACHENKDR
jgi:hypothetical protein